MIKRSQAKPFSHSETLESISANQTRENTIKNQTQTNAYFVDSYKNTKIQENITDKQQLFPFIQKDLLPIPYQEACIIMQNTVQAIKIGQKQELLWFLEHFPVYTYGARTNPQHVAMAEKTGVPLCLSDRGGQMTFHGPGQRIVYILICLRKRNWSVSHYITVLQQWIIDALKLCGIQSWALPEHIGIWTNLGKVASIGVRISRGITSHGLAINIQEMRTGHGFDCIVPCGLVGMPMTTVRSLNSMITQEDVDCALLATFPF